MFVALLMMLHPTQELEPPVNPVRFSGLIKIEPRTSGLIREQSLPSAKTGLCPLLRASMVASAITSIEKARRGNEHDFIANDCSLVPARANRVCSPPQTGSDVRWGIGTNKTTCRRIVNPMGV